MAIKDALGGISWSEWPAELKDREEAALNQKREELAGEIAFYKFQQFMFLKQWKALKAYANEKGIRIIGDIPIYVHLTAPTPGQIRFCSSLMRQPAKSSCRMPAGCVLRNRTALGQPVIQMGLP